MTEDIYLCMKLKIFLLGLPLSRFCTGFLAIERVQTNFISRDDR